MMRSFLWVSVGQMLGRCCAALGLCWASVSNSVGPMLGQCWAALGLYCVGFHGGLWNEKFNPNRKRFG